MHHPSIACGFITPKSEVRLGLAVGAPTFNASTQEREEGRFLWGLRQLGRHRETLS